MKRFVKVLLCALLVFSLTACNEVQTTSGLYDSHNYSDASSDNKAPDNSDKTDYYSDITATDTLASADYTTPQATVTTTPPPQTTTITSPQITTTTPQATTTTPPQTTTTTSSQTTATTPQTTTTTPQTTTTTSPQTTITTPQTTTTTPPQTTTTTPPQTTTTTVNTTTTPMTTEPPVMVETPEDSEAEFSPQVNGGVKYTNSTSLPVGAERLLRDYYNKWYHHLGKLRFGSLSELFDLSSVYGVMYSEFNDTILEYLIYVRQSRDLDFRYEKAQYTLTIKKVEYVRGELIVTYEVAEAIEFNCIDRTSYSCGIEVVSRMVKASDGRYLFTQVAEDTDINVLLERKVLAYLGYKYGDIYLKDLYIAQGTKFGHFFRDTLARLKYAADADTSKLKSQYERFTKYPDKYKSKKTADHAYNREKAVEYSYKYAGRTYRVRNSRYTDYSDYGGNCQHFASQAIHYSGVPMDFKGDEICQWKWYGNSINSQEKPRGRSLSWAVVGYFYDYCVSNKGPGLVTAPDINLYAAEKGDIIQYYSDDWGRHTVIVSDILYDENGNIIEILINSNTTDRVDFPLTAYGYTDIRLIHIVGWND